MTTKTVTHLIIAAALAGSAATSLQLTPSLAPTPGSSAVPVKAETAPSGGALFFILPVAADRLTASCAGLKLAPPPIVCLTP
jgi:hypothetical protein